VGWHIEYLYTRVYLWIHLDLHLFGFRQMPLDLIYLRTDRFWQSSKVKASCQRGLDFNGIKLFFTPLFVHFFFFFFYTFYPLSADSIKFCGGARKNLFTIFIWRFCISGNSCRVMTTGFWWAGSDIWQSFEWQSSPRGSRFHLLSSLKPHLIGTAPASFPFSPKCS